MKGKIQNVPATVLTLLMTALGAGTEVLLTAAGVVVLLAVGAVALAADCGTDRYR